MSDDFRDFDNDDDGFGFDDEDFSFDDVDFGDDGGDDFGDLEPSGISFDDFEDEDDVSLDEDYLGAAGFDDEDIDIDDDPEEEGGGVRLPFIILGILVLLLLFGGIGAFILNQQQEQTNILNITRTAIAIANETTAAQVSGVSGTATQSFVETETAIADAEEQANIAATQTAESVANGTMTAMAQQTLDFQATQTATELQGNSAEMTQTALAFTSFQTQTAIADLLTPDDGVSDVQQTQTAIADLNSGGNTPIGIGAVQQTATALAGLLTTPTQQVGIPGGNTGGALTPIATIPGGTGGDNTGGNNQLPDTGVFDDIAPGALAGIALILGLALIFARGGRIVNKNS